MIPRKILEGLKPDMQEVAELAAATGVSYFKGSFRRKGFAGKAWQPAKAARSGKRRGGSLMVRRAALLNSVRAAEVAQDRVVWAAGNDKVPYAQVHNEGGRAGRGKGFDMPQRQFMGEAEELERQLTRRIETYMRGIFK